MKHSHNFLEDYSKSEKKTLFVIAITATMMGFEIVGGIVFGSMALLADGFHMATHTIAFLITLFAYKYADKHKNSDRFSFGTGKVPVLGGFTSSISLLIIAIIMAIESIVRLFNPVEILMIKLY